MKFIHVTDLHLVAPGEMLWGNDPFARLDACLRDIAAYHQDAAFCFISGDLSERGEKQAYEALKQRLAGFPLKTVLMLGNHDTRDHYFEVFQDAPADTNGYAQQVLDMEGRRFLFLDTVSEPFNSAGWYCQDRQNWLQDQLASAPGDIYIAMHHPPFDINIKYMDRIKLEQNEAFAALIAGNPKVRHLFFGHVHRVVFGSWRGVPYSALPALNHQVPLVGGSVNSPYSDEPPMYGVISLNEDQMLVHYDAFWDRKELPDPPRPKKS
ncbi:MAG: phosphodiesterase [Rhizobiales bacterium]|nr:phosphodiesterase [Hyphomicrobiales bacterium]